MWWTCDFQSPMYLCECCLLFRGPIRSRKDFRSNYILHHVRLCHMRPYGDCLFSLKIDFLMQKLHKPVVKQNILFSDFVCYSVRYYFQHNNGIPTICIPSPTVWPCVLNLWLVQKVSCLLGASVFLQMLELDVKIASVSNTVMLVKACLMVLTVRANFVCFHCFF